MEDRGERRARTIRYGERTRLVHLRQVHPDGVVDCLCELSAWKFAKGKAVGCRCRRTKRGLSPKLAGSLCHSGGGGYHPCVRERIDGKRLAKGWLSELRGVDPLDIEL